MTDTFRIKLKPEVIDTLADHVIKYIMNDLQDRSGLGDAWDQIDEETQNEIRDCWRDFIHFTLDTANL